MTTRAQPLRDADELQYVSLDEALVLYGEIKGLIPEQVTAELRDIGLLDSALSRPLYAAQYAEADLAEQAATLMWGLAQNQPFIDGNKRLALVVGLTFLALNAGEVEMSEDEKVQMMIDISRGMTVGQLAKLLRVRLRRIP
ncbi:MAG: type II toxin-antitoxin system death-on-curing family toxin [Actinomycetota bacterium]